MQEKKKIIERQKNHATLDGNAISIAIQRGRENDYFDDTIITTLNGILTMLLFWVLMIVSVKMSVQNFM